MTAEMNRIAHHKESDREVVPSTRSTCTPASKSILQSLQELHRIPSIIPRSRFYPYEDMPGRDQHVTFSPESTIDSRNERRLPLMQAVPNEGTVVEVSARSSIATEGLTPWNVAEINL